MASSTPPLLRLCYFDYPNGVRQSYFCYHDENCCREGCCTPYSFNHFQKWNLWYKIILVLAILSIFAIYRYFRHICRTRQNIEEEIDDNAYSMNLISDGINTNNSRNKDNDPPPVYSVAINFPKPGNSNQVPTYDQAIAMK